MYFKNYSSRVCASVQSQSNTELSENAERGKKKIRCNKYTQLDSNINISTQTLISTHSLSQSTRMLVSNLYWRKVEYKLEKKVLPIINETFFKYIHLCLNFTPEMKIHVSVAGRMLTTNCNETFASSSLSTHGTQLHSQHAPFSQIH